VARRGPPRRSECRRTLQIQNRSATMATRWVGKACDGPSRDGQKGRGATEQLSEPVLGAVQRCCASFSQALKNTTPPLCMKRFIPPGVRNASREGICEAVRRESEKKTDLERSLDQNRSAKMSAAPPILDILGRALSTRRRSSSGSCSISFLGAAAPQRAFHGAGSQKNMNVFTLPISPMCKVSARAASPRSVRMVSPTSCLLLRQ
jgi:hypothetical protein